MVCSNPPGMIPSSPSALSERLPPPLCSAPSESVSIRVVSRMIEEMPQPFFISVLQNMTHLPRTEISHALAHLVSEGRVAWLGSSDDGPYNKL